MKKVFAKSLLLLVLTIPSILTATTSITENKTLSESISVIYTNKFEKDILSLITSIKKENYANSIEKIEKIKSSLLIEQQEVISSFFPKTFQNMTPSLHKNYDNTEFSDINHGIVFTQRYKSPNGKYLEINIINDPHSIKDYQDLINNPELSSNLKNTQIILNNGYKSLQTANEESQLFEQNIVLKSNLLLTLIEFGFSKEEVFSEFITQSNLKELEEYFLK